MNPSEPAIPHGHVLTREMMEQMASSLGAAVDNRIVQALASPTISPTYAKLGTTSTTNRTYIPTTLEKFEKEFKEKYNCDFEDFFEAVLSSHPEIKI